MQQRPTQHESAWLAVKNRIVQHMLAVSRLRGAKLHQDITRAASADFVDLRSLILAPPIGSTVSLQGPGTLDMFSCALIISLTTCTVGADIEAADSILRSLERSADDESTSVPRPRAERCPPPLMQLALDDAWDAHAVDYSDLDSYTPNPVRSIGSIDLRTGRHRAFFEELRGGIMAHSRTPRRAVDRGEWLAPEQFASTDAQCRAARPRASAGCDRALFPLGGAVLSEEVHCFQPVPWPARPPSCAFKRYTLRELRALTAKLRVWVQTPTAQRSRR